MAKPLTENMVLISSRAASLRNVKNLNCWGMDIDDVSILTYLPNLEVLNLSVNHISSLRDLAFCPKLKEIYLRKNRIVDLTEIAYLRNLPCLKVLWLSENPCSKTKNYKLTVLRNLPNLTKLDNIEVDDEDRQNAMLEGDKVPLCESLPDFKQLNLSKTLETCDIHKLMSYGNSFTYAKGKEYRDQKKCVDIESVNKKRSKLGLRPLNVIHCDDEHELQEDSLATSTSRILSATLLLINELDITELKSLHDKTKERIRHLESLSEVE